MVTPARRFTDPKIAADPNVVKVVFDRRGRANISPAVRFPAGFWPFLPVRPPPVIFTGTWASMPTAWVF